MPVLKEKLKAQYHHLLHINDSPQKIAAGFAVGAFIGIFPTFFLGGIIAVGICALFKLNYVSAIAGAIIIMNPLTTPMFWALNAGAGSLIFSKDTRIILDAIHNKHILGSLNEIALVYITGSTIVGLAVALISYVAVKSIIEKRHAGNR